MIVKNIGMRLKGFTKIKLTDKKGVLNDNNNFYWFKKCKMKDMDGIETIKILPKTGTQIRTVNLREPSYGDIFGIFGKPPYYKAIKEVKKADGNVILRVNKPLGEYFIAKYKEWLGVIGNYKVLAKKTSKDIRNEEIQEFKRTMEEVDRAVSGLVKNFGNNK